MEPFGFEWVLTFIMSVAAVAKELAMLEILAIASKIIMAPIALCIALPLPVLFQTQCVQTMDAYVKKISTQIIIAQSFAMIQHVLQHIGKNRIEYRYWRLMAILGTRRSMSYWRFYS
jgi:hypothetical protein